MRPAALRADALAGAVTGIGRQRTRRTCLLIDGEIGILRAAGRLDAGRLRLHRHG